MLVMYRIHSDKKCQNIKKIVCRNAFKIIEEKFSLCYAKYLLSSKNGK